MNGMLCVFKMSIWVSGILLNVLYYTFVYTVNIPRKE